MTVITQELTGDLFIGLERRPGSGSRLQASAPATGAPLDGTFALASIDDVRAAAALAAQAFDDVRAVGPAARADFLDGIADALERDGDAILARAGQESGLSAGRLSGELARTTGQLRFFARNIRDDVGATWTVDEALADRRPPRQEVRSRVVPVGPVAVFGASNFPLAFSNAGGDTAAALAAGCPVIVKSHEAHPGTAELVSTAITSAVRAHGMPAGTYSALLATDHEVGRALVTDSRIAAVGFTGSRRAGVALVHAAQGRPVPIPVYAEMSSINPVIVLSSAATRQTAHDYVDSFTLGSGQFCTSPGVLFLSAGSVGDAFVADVADAVSEVAGQTMLTPGIHESFERGRDRLAASSSEVGRGRVGDARLAPAPSVHQVDLDRYLAEPELSDEVFGAASLIVRYASIDALLSAIGLLEGQLTATVHATENDSPDVARLIAALELRAGRIVFNGWPTGVDVVDSQVHGGPFPATSDPRTTSVGGRAPQRFQRTVAYQNLPSGLIP